MRPSTLRPRAATTRGSRSNRQAVGLVVAVGTAGLLAVSCDTNNSRATAASSPSRDVAAIAVPSPSSMAPRNEVSGIMATPASASLRKVATEQAERAAAGPAMPHATAVSPSSASAMIIRTGTAGIEVDSLDTAIARVRTLALRVNGYVANTAVQGGRDQLRSASLEVKIPAERFDDALAGLSPIGKVESVNVNAEDVGEEYVDIQARVENARRLEARIIDLLANRTGKLQDVLSVEHELARVREEIERYEGRMRFLKSRAAMSTLTIAVHEHAPIIVPVAGDGPITFAFRQAWQNFVGLSAGFIASLGVLVPLGVLVFAAWLGVRRWVPPLGRRGGPVAPAPNAVEVSGD